MKMKLMQTERKIEKQSGHEPVRCNLCHKPFRAATKYHRFCRTCKMDEDLFRFSEWLPVVSSG